MKLINIEWSKSEWVNRRSYMSNRIPTDRGAARIIANLLNERGGHLLFEREGMREHDIVRPTDITIHRIQVSEYAR